MAHVKGKKVRLLKGEANPTNQKLAGQKLRQILQGREHDPAAKSNISVAEVLELYLKLNQSRYPEDGIRLLKKEDLEYFEERMKEFKISLQQKTTELDSKLWDLKQEAKTRLGDLYNENQYPTSFFGCFEVDWSYPSVEPPEYLKELSPGIFQQEKQKVESRFAEAIQLAEQMFLKELQGIVDCLHQELVPGPDGKKKKIYESAVGNFGSFFDKFKQLNPSDNEEIQNLINVTKSLMSGVTTKDLKNSSELQKEIQEGLGKIKEIIPSLITKSYGNSWLLCGSRVNLHAPSTPTGTR